MWLVKKIFIFYLASFLFSFLTFPQNFGLGIQARLCPSVSQSILNNNLFSTYELDNFLFTGLFISYKTQGRSQWMFTLKYSFGQKDVSQPKGLSLYEPKKLFNLYSFDLAVCYVVDLSPKLKINTGIMPGYYIAKLNERYNDEKDYYEYKFNLTPIVGASFEVYEKTDINFLIMYSIEKYKIVKNYSYSSGGYQQIISGFDELDFSGLNFGLAVTYWIDL